MKQIEIENEFVFYIQKETYKSHFLKVNDKMNFQKFTKALRTLKNIAC